MDNNIKNFTSADIEKYHKGQLSAAEMHDLEKAAMDDPFLADALEGYAVAGVDPGADIAELKKRLAEKVEGAKVIPLHTAPRNSFRILRVAILLVFIAGAGLLVYQFGFNKKSSEIAQSEPAKNEGGKDNDTLASTITNPATITPTTDSETKSADTRTGPVMDKTVTTSTEKQTKTVGETNTVTDETSIATGKLTTEDGANKPASTQPVVAAPAKAAEQRDQNKVLDKVADKKELAREESDNKNRLKTSKQEPGKDQAKDEAFQDNKRAMAGNRNADNNQYYNANTFRGRVTDAGNVGVPFANVTNIQDNNAGTYTDAKGYFNLTYPDSVLTVQVRSVGFENTNVQLRNSVPTNQVILQDDRKDLAEVVISKQKPNTAARKQDGTMKLEEPEPADGWDNYDTYLVNNLNIPDDLKTKQSDAGAVELSFEVDKNGEPVNIKVEKSLCGKCDKEAIRLVKEGPKWKRKAKKGRTTITVYF